jgi:hypothetical protein
MKSFSFLNLSMWRQLRHRRKTAYLALQCYHQIDPNLDILSGPVGATRSLILRNGLFYEKRVSYCGRLKVIFVHIEYAWHLAGLLLSCMISRT